MITMRNYADLLAELQTIAPSAHIAGGAVRDTILEKPLRDVDIFMDDEHVEEAAKFLRSRLGFVKVGEWRQYLGFSDPAMTRVAKFEKAEETIPLCIIGLKSRYATPEANVARFDFGICMCAFDGENILQADEFYVDRDNKTFTLCRADNEYQFAYSMSRYEKITAGRYAGWDITIPREFWDFVKEYEFHRRWYLDCGKGFDGKSTVKPKERVLA